MTSARALLTLALDPNVEVTVAEVTAATADITTAVNALTPTPPAAPKPAGGSDELPRLGGDLNGLIAGMLLAGVGLTLVILKRRQTV